MAIHKITLSEKHDLRLLIRYEPPYKEKGPSIILNAAIVWKQKFMTYTPNQLTRARREFKMFEQGDQHNRILKLQYSRNEDNPKRIVPILVWQYGEDEEKDILVFGRSDAGTITDSIMGAFARMTLSEFMKESETENIEEWTMFLKSEGFPI